MVAGGIGYALVSAGLAAVGITPVGWVGIIGVAGLSTILANVYNQQFESTIDKLMD